MTSSLFQMELMWRLGFSLIAVIITSTLLILIAVMTGLQKTLMIDTPWYRKRVKDRESLSSKKYEPNSTVQFVMTRSWEAWWFTIFLASFNLYVPGLGPYAFAVTVGIFITWLIPVLFMVTVLRWNFKAFMKEDLYENTRELEPVDDVDMSKVLSQMSRISEDLHMGWERAVDQFQEDSNKAIQEAAEKAAEKALVDDAKEAAKEAARVAVREVTGSNPVSDGKPKFKRGRSL